MNTTWSNDPQNSKSCDIDFQIEESLTHHSAAHVMYSLNLNSGKFDFISPTIETLTGFTIDEVNERGFKSLIKEIVLEEYHRFKSSNDKSSEIEESYRKYLIETKSGKQKWIDDNSFVFIKENGGHQTAIGILRDISSLQMFINNLDAEKSNLNKVFDLAATMLLKLDSNLNIVMINNKGCDILSGEKQDIIGRNITDFIPQNIKNDFNKFINEKGSSSKSLDGEIHSLDNKTKFIEWNNTILRDSKGDLISIIATGNEITDRKQNEKIREVISEILNEANSEKNIDELFKFIHKSVSKLMKTDNFYISHYDQDTNRLTFPYFVDELDETAEPIELGSGLTSYVFKKGKSVLLDKEKMDELAVMGKTEVIGSMPEVWLGVPLKIKKKVIGVLVVQDYNDASAYGNSHQQILDVIAYPVSRAIERKIVESEKEKMINQLSELNKSKDKLFSLISHDLRNPFNSLLGFAEIITTEYDSLTRDEVMEYLNVINVSAKNLFGMTNNLLHYSRFQLGKYACFPSSVKVEELVESAIEQQKYNVQNKGIFIKRNIQDNATVWVDQELITLTLGNIIENAVKYSHPEATVSVTVKEGDNDQVQIIINDSGLGISPSDLLKIERKEMFSTQGTNRESGAGLGLILSREFIRMNSGEFIIESNVGVGTSISILLPSKNLV